MPAISTTYANTGHFSEHQIWPYTHLLGLMMVPMHHSSSLLSCCMCLQSSAPGRESLARATVLYLERNRAQTSPWDDANPAASPDALGYFHGASPARHGGNAGTPSPLALRSSSTRELSSAGLHTPPMSKTPANLRSKSTRRALNWQPSPQQHQQQLQEHGAVPQQRTQASALSADHGAGGVTGSSGGGGVPPPRPTRTPSKLPPITTIDENSTTNEHHRTPGESPSHVYALYTDLQIERSILNLKLRSHVVTMYAQGCSGPGLHSSLRSHQPSIRLSDVPDGMTCPLQVMQSRPRLGGIHWRIVQHHHQTWQQGQRQQQQLAVAAAHLMAHLHGRT